MSTEKNLEFEGSYEEMEIDFDATNDLFDKIQIPMDIKYPILCSVCGKDYSFELTNKFVSEKVMRKAMKCNMCMDCAFIYSIDEKEIEE